MKAKLFDIPDEQARFLESFAGEAGESQVGCVRNGIRLLREAVAARRKGGTIAIVSGDGVVSPLIGPWSDVATNDRGAA